MAAEGLSSLHSHIVGRLNDLRVRGELCDLTLISSDNIYCSLHSSVAAASSDVFHTFLVTGQLPVVPVIQVYEDGLYLEDIDYNILKLAIDFMYGLLPNNLSDLLLMEDFAVKYRLLEFQQLKKKLFGQAVHDLLYFDAHEIKQNIFEPERQKDYFKTTTSKIHSTYCQTDAQIDEGGVAQDVEHPAETFFQEGLQIYYVSFT